MEQSTSWFRILKYAGAFTAFMIGSGFATGQEILQFFTAYGIWGICGVLISMFLFAWSGATIMKYGYENKWQYNNSAFKYFCGKVIGTFLEWFIPLFLFVGVIVMFSGAGATANQYFGLPHFVGAAIMAVLVMISNMFGLKRLIDIIGCVGPITILFTIIIAIAALEKKPEILVNLSTSLAQVGNLPKVTNSKSTWWLASILYVAYNVTAAIPFLAEMGKEAGSRKEAALGAVIGAVAFMTSGFLLNFALLSYISDVSDLDIPNLYFAEMITPAFGLVFSIILLCEIFSTAAPMLWVITHSFSSEGTRRNRILVIIFSTLAFFGGQLPFGMLIGTVYPYTGYLGIVVLIFIAKKTLSKERIGL